MLRFTVIDVATANPRLASICQIGATIFEGERCAQRWSTLVDPGPDHPFDPISTRLHGITSTDVRDMPSFGQLLPNLRSFLRESIAVTYSPFARGAILRASQEIGETPPASQWLDALRVLRRLLPSLSCGYSLVAVAAHLGVPLENDHDAGLDAEAVGRVLFAACRLRATRLDDVFADHAGAVDVAVSDPTVLAGETLVFTGALLVPRADATAIASAAGCAVAANVTKSTTILVVGDQDTRLVGPTGKSNKHRKAEKLIASGQAIRILGESDFFGLLRGT